MGQQNNRLTEWIKNSRWLTIYPYFKSDDLYFVDTHSKNQNEKRVFHVGCFPIKNNKKWNLWSDKPPLSESVDDDAAFPLISYNTVFFWLCVALSKPSSTSLQNITWSRKGSEFISSPVRPKAVTDGWILWRLRLVARRATNKSGRQLPHQE